jgi:hypothetical protein
MRKMELRAASAGVGGVDEIECESH